MPADQVIADGRVSRVDRGMCDVLTSRGTVRAQWGPDILHAVRQDPAALPSVGDEVLLETQGDQIWLTHVVPRRNAVTRASVAPGSSHQQVLAANIDVLAICEPCQPTPAEGRIERLLALAWESASHPAVLLTKADLSPDLAGTVESISRLALGASVIAVSTPDGIGLDEVQELTTAGQALALLGPSGAGKSTIVNALLGSEAMPTSHVRDDGKGRHTTAHRELVQLDDGSFIIDTPGLRSIGLSTSDGLDQAFADIVELSYGCHFNDCAHETEPGCAVLAAIERGDVPPRRLDSYRKLLREAAYQERRGDARLQAEERARWKSFSRQIKQQTRRNRP